MPAFTEFKEFKNSLRYLKKRGIELKKGSTERKNLKMLFDNMGAKNNFAIGYLIQMCKCGKVGDHGRIIAMKRDTAEYKKYTETEEVPLIFCDDCSNLSMLIISKYGLNAKNTTKVLELIWKLKEGQTGK